MKILHVCNHFYPCVGGIEKHVGDLCRNLIKLGHGSDIACLNTCTRGEKLPEFQEREGSKIYRIPYLNLSIYKVAPGVLRLIKDYDMVHVHGLGFFIDFLTTTKFIHKKPLVLTTHGGIFHTKRLSFLKKIYFYLWCNLDLRKVDKIIAVSKSDERLFSRINPNVELIPNAIETEDFIEIEKEKENKAMLYVGRISQNKRIDNLIKTLYFLKRKVPDIKLYIVGEDWEGIKRDLENLAKKKGLEDNVIFIGGIQDKNELLKYFSRSQFFVSASEYEGFGISVLEAMAAGCIAIVNDIPAFRNLIKDKENGFLVDFSNHEESTDSILNLMSRDLKNVEENAVMEAKEYDWKKTVLKITEVYEKVIKQ